jgi:hypothetical protein
MRHVILTTAAAAFLLLAAASARVAGMQLAMGPTSAAHLPGGQPRGNTAPDCSLPYGQCPEGRMAPKYPYRTPKHPRHKRHLNY